VGRKPRRSLKADVVVGGATPAIQAKSSPDSPARSTIDAVFGGLGGIDYRLSTGVYVSGDDLAAAIEANPGDTLPDRVRDYLCRFLRGEVKPKRGPKKPEMEKLLIEVYAEVRYYEILRWLQNRRKVAGGRAKECELAPHELAAMIIKRRFRYFRSVSPRRIANILSSRRHRR
jgi:hypothetical protein